MTQTPEDPQNLPETPSAVGLSTYDSFSAPSETSAIEAAAAPAEVPVVVAPIPTPTFVYAPPVTFAEQFHNW